MVASCQHYKYWLCILSPSISVLLLSASETFSPEASFRDPKRRQGERRTSREREETINSGSMCWSRVFIDETGSAAERRRMDEGKEETVSFCMFCPFRIRVISLSGSSSSSSVLLLNLSPLSLLRLSNLTSLLYSLSFPRLGIPSNMKRRVISEILALHSLQMVVVNTTS